MPTKTQHSDAEALDDHMIDRLYEVAVDPSRLESLLDHWEEVMGPRRAATQGRDSIDLPGYVPHFQRADKVLANVLDDGSADSQATDPGHLLNRIERTAGFVIDRTLTISHANTAASMALGVTRGAPLSGLALANGEAVVLAEQIKRLLASNSGEPLALRVRSARAERMILMHLRLIRPERGDSFVIALASELGWPEGFSAMLAQAFELTPAEVEVVRSMTEGLGPKDIALARGRSVETIRAQIKSVLAKTETRSQVELVRLTLSTMEMAQFTGDVAAQLPGISTGLGHLPERPFHTITLPDGRRMDYLILGDFHGKPIYFSPLDYGLVRWPASAEAEAAKRGIKVIVPVRAGYGKSTPLPKGANHLDQLAQDAVYLLDHLGIDRLPVITLGGDSRHMMAVHRRDPNRISALICCAGVLPMTRPEHYERMDKWHRFILAGARYTPHLLPFMVKAGFALAHRLGKRGFIQAVYGKSQADVSTFDIPEVFEAMVCGSEVALSDEHSAHDAFAREIIACETTDWSADLASIEAAAKAGTLPVHFLNGLQCPQIHRDTLAEFQTDYPWIDFRIYPDAGQLLFFLKWRDALELAEGYIDT